jgi:hypothetical protein
MLNITCPSLITVTYSCDVILEKSTDSTHKNVSQPKPHHILCDVIQPCVMYGMKENKRKKSGISPPKKYIKKHLLLQFPAFSQTNQSVTALLYRWEKLSYLVSIDSLNF